MTNDPMIQCLNLFPIATFHFQKPLGRSSIGTAPWSITTDGSRSTPDERELQSPHEAPQPGAPREHNGDSTSPATGTHSRRVRATC
jgi:hypothetical protein